MTIYFRLPGWVLYIIANKIHWMKIVSLLNELWMHNVCRHLIYSCVWLDSYNMIAIQCGSYFCEVTANMDRKEFIYPISCPLCLNENFYTNLFDLRSHLSTIHHVQVSNLTGLMRLLIEECVKLLTRIHSERQ